MELQQLITRLIGLAAVTIGIAAFIRQDDKSVKKMMSMASLLWVIYHATLGAWTASAISAISMSRQFLSARLDASHKLGQRLMYVFLSINAIALAITWHGPISMCPFIGSSISTYAMFKLKHERFRYAMLASGLMWGVSAAYFQAYEALTATAISSGVILATMKKTRLHRLREERARRALKPLTAS